MLSLMCETILDIKLCDNNQNIITFYLFYSTLILPKCYPPYTIYLHMADNRLYFIWWVANKTSAQSSAVSSGCRGGTWALTPHHLTSFRACLGDMNKNQAQAWRAEASFPPPMSVINLIRNKKNTTFSPIAILYLSSTLIVAKLKCINSNLLSCLKLVCQDSHIQSSNHCTRM